jgi:tetratricopeptide (TPR) repeat protein
MYGESSRIAAAMLIAAGLCWGAPAGADDPAKPPAEAPRNLPSIQRQPGDDPATPLNPVEARTPQEQRVLDAVAHYMAGELYLERGRLNDALEELEQAIDLDPKSIAPYQLYIPTAVREGQHEQAQKYALKAAQHAKEGVQLLRALVAVYLQQDDVDEAIKVLSTALDSQGLPESGFGRLILQRHLGQCLELDAQHEQAAKAYETLQKTLDEKKPSLSEEERLQLFGEKQELYEEMGQVFLKTKRPELAVKAFETAAKARDSMPGVHGYNLALVFQQTGKPQRALEELEKYFRAQLSEKGRAPYQLLKDLLAELDRKEELVKRLEEMLASDKHNRFLTFFLADQYVEQQRFDEAAKLYNETAGGASPEALVGLSSIYRQQGKYEDWLETAGRAFATLQLGNQAMLSRLNREFQEMAQRFTEDTEKLAQEKEQVAAVMELGRKKSTGDDPDLDFEQAWLLGRIAVDAERTQDAKHFYRYAIGTQNLPSFDLFRELGAHFIEVEEYTEAETVFQEAADHPSFGVARSFFLSLVSVAREMDGRIDAAVEAIQEARKLNPEQSQYAVQEARIYYRARRWDDAIKQFQELIESNPQDKKLVRDSQFSLSALYVQKGDVEAGEEILLDILEEEPDNTQANNDLAYLWADQNKNIDRARPMVEKALKAEPENPAYIDTYGWVLYREGKFAEAVEQLEKASKLPNGEDSTIYDHLGDAWEKQGRHEKAVEAWKKALQLEMEKSFSDPELLEDLKQKVPADQHPKPAGDEKPE